MLIVVMLVTLVVVIHLIGSLKHQLFRDVHYNQNIVVNPEADGKVVGDVISGKPHLLVAYDGNTIVGNGVEPREHVTSEFQRICVRLRSEESGREIEGWMDQELLIGRAGGGQGEERVELADPLVSGKHCLIYRRGDKILLQDLGSTNGTYVNGLKLEGAVPLSNGDRIRIGSSTYRFNAYYWKEGSVT